MAGHERGVVLLGEDDDVQRELLREVLEAEGYRVLPAASASELVSRLAEQPDLVLMDIVGMTSPSVLRALELPTRRTKLCLISGATLLVRAAERLGADAYVQKPFELETLLGHVARLMGDEPRGRLPPVA